jgi:phenylacetic acid degradation operon negative regulatory protein
VLRDPSLPSALYPKPWPGDEVRQIVRDVYRAVAASSEHWLDQHGTCSHGPLPPPQLDLRGRFIDGPGNQWTGRPPRSKIGAAE